MRLLLVVVLGSTILTPPRVTIRATPQSITCIVPRNEDNRYLTIGIDYYMSHGVPLEGDRAPVTHRLWLKQSYPCLREGDDHLDAFCKLEYAPEGVEVVKQFLPCLPPDR